MAVDIMILGSQGQVGFELMHQECRWSRTGMDRDELDITNAKALKQAILEQQPRLLVNAAAYTAVDRAEEEQELAYAVNAGAVKTMAEACQQLDIPLLHISTDYVFSGEKSGAYSETDSVHPQSVYGASKAEGDRLLAEAGIKYLTLRVSWVFGAHGNNFVRTMLRLATQRDELGIVADQHGCPTSARSIAAALLQTADQYLQGNDVAWGLYHYANLPASNWFEFACEIFAQNAQLTGAKTPKVNAITTADYPTPAKRPANSVMACDVFAETFGAEFVPQWRDELSLVLKMWAEAEDS